MGVFFFRPPFPPSPYKMGFAVRGSTLFVGMGMGVLVLAGLKVEMEMEMERGRIGGY